MNSLVEVKSSWKDSDLRIEFMLGNVCNYKCWYCFPGSNEGNIRFPDYDITLTNLLHLIKHYKSKGKNRFFVHIIGGEPTLWPKLGEFAQELSKENCYISLSTNGSRTIRWWKENAKYFKKVVVSYHPEEVDVQHNMEVCDILHENGCIVNASVLMDPTKWDQCISIIDKLKSSNRRWSILASEVLHSTVNYSEDQKDYLKGYVKRLPNLIHYIKNNKHPLKNIKVVLDNNKTLKVKDNWIIANKLNYFKGWDCNLGKDSIFISSTGNITGTCNQKIYNSDEYYNLFDVDFIKKFSPDIDSTICTNDGCFCQAEVNLKKKKV